MTDILVFIRWLFLRSPTPSEWWDFYNAYLRTRHWRRFTDFRRKSALSRLLGWNRCARCGSCDGLQTHHRAGAYTFMWREYFHLLSFQTLCGVCHARETAKNRN